MLPKLLSFLRERPGASERAIAKGVQTNRQTVHDALERLAQAGHVDAIDGPRKARLWRAF